MSYNEALQRKVSRLITRKGNGVEMAFRGQTITVRRTESFRQREFLSAGVRDAADYEVYMTDGNVAGGGAPKPGEAIIHEGVSYDIIGVRPSEGNVFFTLNIRRGDAAE